jgi:pilus assembly protein Flp/PilA
MMQFIQQFVREDDGQGMVEYGIILGLVSVATILVLTTTGTDIGLVFTEVNTQLSTVPGV